MNLLLVVVLGAVAWFLMESGQTFIAFLAIIILVLAATSGMTQERKASHATPAHTDGHGHGRARGERTHRYTIKDPWMNTKTLEDRFEGMGRVFFWPLKAIVSFMRRSGR